MSINMSKKMRNRAVNSDYVEGYEVFVCNDDGIVLARCGDVKDSEHRAEVAQLIAKRACDIAFSEEINNEEWDEVIFNYKKEKGIREIGITPNILYDYLKEQSEHELAEEGEDEKLE